MINTLINAKPGVGSSKEWKKHEERHSSLKSKLKGMHLQKEYKGFCSQYNNKNSIENFNQGNTGFTVAQFKSPLSQGDLRINDALNQNTAISQVSDHQRFTELA